MNAIAHVNLARGFRGGERQTVLLIIHLKKQHPELKQILVCRKGAEILSYVKDIQDLEIIQINTALNGHIKVGHRVEIIQAHEAKAVHWASIHHLFYGTPYVITRRVPQTVKNNIFNRINFKNAAAIVAISKAIRTSIEKSFTGTIDFNNKINLIYSVLSHMESDPDKLAAIRKEWADHPVFGHVGALVDKHKGQKVLIAAAKIFLKSHPECRFVFLGIGSDQKEFTDLTADTPEIKWLGFKTDVINYIENMFCFVFPSRNEGLGSVLLDVMDHKVPIIASEVDGIPEIVHNNETGLLFPNGDSAELLKRMELIYKDPDLRKKLTETAYRNLDHFRPEYMASCYTELYKQILEQKK